MKVLLAALLLVPALAACSDDQPARATPTHPGPSLSADEIERAEGAARRELADQDAKVTSATLTARAGKVTDSNTGTPCTSGRLLLIKLIGDFPHIVTTGHPVLRGQPAPDFTVRAVKVTADARSGVACLVGVQTGKPQPEPGATVLHLGG